jgi:hypothetical protein
MEIAKAETQFNSIQPHSSSFKAIQAPSPRYMKKQLQNCTLKNTNHLPSMICETKISKITIQN